MGESACSRPRVRALHDEADDRERAHDGTRRGHRSRGAGAGAVHAASRFRRGSRCIQTVAAAEVFMKLSSDDLAFFFEPHHLELAARLTAARAALEAAEAHASEGARDLAAVDALAKAQLFALVAPASGKVDSR